MAEEDKRFEEVIEPQVDRVSAPGIPARSYYGVIDKFEEGTERKTAGNVPENLVKKEVEEQVRYVPAREVDFVEVAARTDGWV